MEIDKHEFSQGNQHLFPIKMTEDTHPNYLKPQLNALNVCKSDSKFMKSLISLYDGGRFWYVVVDQYEFSQSKH